VEKAAGAGVSEKKKKVKEGSSWKRGRPGLPTKSGALLCMELRPGPRASFGFFSKKYCRYFQQKQILFLELSINCRVVIHCIIHCIIHCKR
jgi:hypothetical protein